jgi:hypothetical protein
LQEIEITVKTRSFVEGVGIAILLLANLLWPLLSPYHLTIYHDPLSVSAIATGFALDLAVLGIFFAIVLVLLDYYRPEQSGFLWAALLACCVTKAVDFTIFLFTYYGVSISWVFESRVVLLCAMFIAGLLFSRFSPRAFQKSVQAARFGFLLLGCCVFWMAPQLVYTAIRTHKPAPNSFNRTVQPPSSSQGRIIWILLDELSYDQVFEHRQPSVNLPHFDELKNESVVFSDVQPEGYYTERILPALFLGRKINNVRSSLRGELYIHDVKASRWEPFNQEASIFGEAERSGWTTGIAGWYNPYCHMLKNVLDSCYWDASDPFPHKFIGGRHAILSAAIYPLDPLLSHLRVFAAPSDSPLQAHAQEYRDVFGAADALIQNESIRFVFLHIPVPHPPGIYDRRTNRLGVKGTYLDNLVLADRTLGTLLGTIQRTEAGARTTLIVSSDHSWRVPMWRPESAWTPEEERASGGRFDPRPFLLIRFPGNNAGEVRTEPFPELATHSVIRAMLKNEVHSQSDLDRWLSGHQD